MAKNSRVISLRILSSEYEQLQMSASAEGLTVSDYARARLFGSARPTPAAYAAMGQRVSTLETRVETLAKLTGVDDAIKQAQDILGGEEG